MTIQELGSVGEFVAAVATVITLGYLALQIRSNTAAVTAEARRNHIVIGHQVMGIVGENLQAASVFRRGLLEAGLGAARHRLRLYSWGQIP